MACFQSYSLPIRFYLSIFSLLDELSFVVRSTEQYYEIDRVGG